MNSTISRIARKYRINQIAALTGYRIAMALRETGNAEAHFERLITNPAPSAMDVLVAQILGGVAQ